MRYFVWALVIGAAGLAAGCGGERVGDESGSAPYYSDDEDDSDGAGESDESDEDEDEDAPRR